MQYFTDFSEYAIGVPPDDWMQVRGTSGSTLTVVDDTSATGGKYASLGQSIIEQGAFVWNDPGSDLTNSDIVVKTRTNSNFGVQAIIYARVDVDSDTHYAAYWTSGSLKLVKRINGSQTEIGSSPFTWEANTWYWMRLRCDGTLIECSIWKDGDTEPPSSMIRLSDSDISVGSVGFGAWGADYVDVDVVGVGVDGQPGPKQRIVITDINGLQNINNDPSAMYELANDIDATITSSWNSNGDGTFQGFEPISNFSGTLDGKGHTIDGLYIRREQIYVGLFARTSPFGSLIKNFRMTNVNIEIPAENFYYYCAPVVAFVNSRSKVEKIFVESGVVHGEYDVGGMFGRISGGEVNECFVGESVSVAGNVGLGGFIGSTNSGTIKNCSSHASVGNSSRYVSTLGGFVGSVTGGHFSNCYATGLVYRSGGVSDCGFAGVDNSTPGFSSYTSCYWDTQTTKQSSSSGNTNGSIALGKTTAEMMQQETFVGWDFTDIWVIDEGNDYPRLRSFSQEEPPQGTIQDAESSVSASASQYARAYQTFHLASSVNSVALSDAMEDVVRPAFSSTSSLAEAIAVVDIVRPASSEVSALSQSGADVSVNRGIHSSVNASSTINALAKVIRYVDSYASSTSESEAIISLVLNANADVTAKSNAIVTAETSGQFEAFSEVEAIAFSSARADVMISGLTSVFATAIQNVSGGLVLDGAFDGFSSALTEAQADVFSVGSIAGSAVATATQYAEAQVFSTELCFSSVVAESTSNATDNLVSSVTSSVMSNSGSIADVTKIMSGVSYANATSHATLLSEKIIEALGGVVGLGQSDGQTNLIAIGKSDIQLVALYDEFSVASFVAMSEAYATADYDASESFIPFERVHLSGSSAIRPFIQNGRTSLIIGDSSTRVVIK